MLDKTFKKLGETFGTMKKEIDDVVKAAKAGETISQQGDVTVRIKNGDVSIDGPLKELRINGKLIRFTKEKP